MLQALQRLHVCPECILHMRKFLREAGRRAYRDRSLGWEHGFLCHRVFEYVSAANRAVGKRYAPQLD